MPQPIIPVLMSDINQLKQPTDIIKYCLRAYMYLPKNISDTFTNDELSFRWDDASVGHDTDAINSQVQLHMTKVLTKYFPTGIVNVTPTITMIDEVRYSISIDIIVEIDGVQHSISSNFVRDSGGNLTYTFNGS